MISRIFVLENLRRENTETKQIWSLIFWFSVTQFLPLPDF